MSHTAVGLFTGTGILACCSPARSQQPMSSLKNTERNRETMIYLEKTCLLWVGFFGRGWGRIRRGTSPHLSSPHFSNGRRRCHIRSLQVQLKDFKIGQDSLLHLLLPEEDGDPLGEWETNVLTPRSLRRFLTNPRKQQKQDWGLEPKVGAIYRFD